MMMQQMAEIYAGGNGQYILLINSLELSSKKTSSESALDKFKLKNRFKINWKFFKVKGNLTSEMMNQIIL